MSEVDLCDESVSQLRPGSRGVSSLLGPITQPELDTRGRLASVDFESARGSLARLTLLARSTLTGSSRSRASTTANLWCRRSEPISTSLERLGDLGWRLVVLASPLLHTNFEFLVESDIEEGRWGSTALDSLEQVLVSWFVVSHEWAIFDRESVRPED